MPEWLAYKAINDVGCSPKFRLPSSTLWLLILDCIERILDQEDALKVHFSLVSSAEHGYVQWQISLYTKLLWSALMEIKLWRNISSWILEIHWVLLGILTGYTWPHCGCRELDLKSFSLYLSHQDTDVGSSFQKQLIASALEGETFIALFWCRTYVQMHLSAPTEVFCTLELFWLELVIQ